MVKKVKTYLSNAEIIEDEDRLIELANQCEPSKNWIMRFCPRYLLFFYEHTNQKLIEFGENVCFRIAWSRMRRIFIDMKGKRISIARISNLRKNYSILVSTIKRRPSPSTSSMSSNSSCDRRGDSVQLTKFGR